VKYATSTRARCKIHGFYRISDFLPIENLWTKFTMRWIGGVGGSRVDQRVSRTTGAVVLHRRAVHGRERSPALTGDDPKG
jgi:hypothetical protein